MKLTLTSVCFALCGLIVAAPLAHAAASPEDAAKLKTSLTPLGAERAGNKEGTIPAWTGGYSTVPAGYKSGDARPDPFGNEKAVISITAKNMDQYADKLSDGIKALLKKYPDSYRVDVYPTHRTANAPQWVYDNTFKNATRAKTKDGGVHIEGAYGGIPFPIPQTGAEIMWNNALMWTGDTVQLNFHNYLTTADGKRTAITRGQVYWQYPYYFKEGSLESFNGMYARAILFQSEPAFKAGESLLIHYFTDKSQQAWQYLAGQRRVRRAPTVAYDTPNDITSGVENYDEIQVFNGDFDRYNLKVVGKRELFVPYNTMKVHLASNDERLGTKHLNPDFVRWELHRVWVVEATLAEGKRHVMPHRIFYLDEDTWGAVLADGWDAQGQLWRTNMGLPTVIPEGPFVHTKMSYTSTNHLTGAYVVSGTADYKGGPFWGLVARKPDSAFTPDALAAAGR